MRPARHAALVLALLAATPGHAQEAPQNGPARMEFDDRLVKGQRHGTGSVYIFERQKVELRSMVRRPRSFRQRIIITVFPE